MKIKNRLDPKHFQLAILGWIAILLAPLVWFSSFLHGFDFPQSISETATMANTVSSLLPIALGALAIFSGTYGYKYSYDYIWDKILPYTMCVGFMLVAFYPTASVYVYQDHVGPIPVTPETAYIIHMIGALVGFGALIAWILVCFTKSDPTREITKQKLYRNLIYIIMGAFILICLPILILAFTDQLQPNFALVSWLETVILFGAGLCCLVKSGLITPLKDGCLEV